MSIKAASLLAGAYGLPVTRIAEPERGYRNHVFRLTLADGTYRNLIQYKREPHITQRIRRANAVGSYLAEAGLPVRAPTDQRILKITGRNTTYAALYNYLPGKTISWEAYTQRHIKLAGMSLAHVHGQLAAWTPPDVVRSHAATSELQHLNAAMSSYLTKYSKNFTIPTKLGIRISQPWLDSQPGLLNYCSHLSNQQTLHLDFVRSNLLFAPATPSDRLQLDGLALTGIIDFEKTAWGHPLLDVSRTLAFLLIDCRYKSPNQVRKYFLHSGYGKRGRGELSKAARPGHSKLLLDELTDWYLMYDFYKFLRHNPYESLTYNEHFRRTVERLMHRQILFL